MDPEFGFGWAHLRNKIVGGGIFHSHALLKLLEPYVEYSIHFLFIFLPYSCGMSLKKIFMI